MRLADARLPTLVADAPGEMRPAACSRWQASHEATAAQDAEIGHRRHARAEGRAGRVIGQQGALRRSSVPPWYVLAAVKDRGAVRPGALHAVRRCHSWKSLPLKVCVPAVAAFVKLQHGE